MPEHMLMSGLEIMTGGGRRRRWSAAERIRIVEETLDERASISVVARRNGVAPNLLYRWRRLMLEGGSVAVTEDDDVTRSSSRDGWSGSWRSGSGNSSGLSGARPWRPRSCARPWTSRAQKTDLARAVAAEGRFPVKVVAETLGVARSNLIDRLKEKTKPRRRYHKAQDAAVVPLITALAAARPTYGYRRITGLLNRRLRSEGLEPVNHKRAYRIVKVHNLLLARKYSERPEHVHDGKVIVMRSNLRWCSDGFEFTCWNGDIIRAAFIIDAHDREIIAWRAVVNAGISGSDVRDMMLEAVEHRFDACRAPSSIEMLSDNGSPYIAKETRIFARQLGLKPCFTPIKSPQSNGISEAFVKTLKRDYVQVKPLPNAEAALGLIANWIEDHNENHPHSGLRMRSPREFIAAQTATA